MASGLSDKDRRRLEEGREWAAGRLAAERQRLAEEARVAAEREEQARQALAEHVAKFGPTEVVGPDGVPVKLTVLRSGYAEVDPGLITELIAIPMAFVLWLGSLVGHHVVFWGGSTLHIEVPGRRKTKLRLRSAEAAAARLRELADAIQRDGVTAIDAAIK